ncbi:putative LRR receptor-like serine/threonine-protein kinase [Capsicum baccatum]|uniref:LRR receptor-like serine/threonine-protein kinase n=1 Tax=Capsicum baccatum TaxID=33114 RepID=A0A2G2XCZ6_CAPBA|nr:putative LRR receptor-like serine/threonine-protein kinase [Capsicum baccatum]
MIDVAYALEYLYHGCSFPVIHCDLKPSNVLLDEDMVSHLSDFGISKLFFDEQQNYGLDFMEVVVFGLVGLGRVGLDLVEVLYAQVPLAELEEFGNRVVYWSLGLGGYEWFGLRYLVELVKYLAIVAMFQE